jgi:mono/diheme cytochrome c family protein
MELYDHEAYLVSGFRRFTFHEVSGLLFGTMALGQAEPKAQSGDVARGQALFIRNCTGCHGPQGGGDGYRLLRGPDPANLTSPSTRKKSDADLLKTIHDGKPNMPSWDLRLSEKESRDVLAYVRTLAK